MPNKILNVQFGDPPRDAKIVFQMLRVEDSLKFLLYIGKLFGGALGATISSSLSVTPQRLIIYLLKILILKL